MDTSNFFICGFNRLFRSCLHIPIITILFLLQIPAFPQENKKLPLIQKTPQYKERLSVSPGRIIKGRLIVQLSPKLWKKTFTLEPKHHTPQGTERLYMSPELERIFNCYGLEKMGRTLPQLEQPLDQQTYLVISYAEYVKKRFQIQKKRVNSRPYTPPKLINMQSSFELKFPDDTNMDQLKMELLKVPGVLSAHTLHLPIPNDPYFPDDPGWTDPYDPYFAPGRWGFHNTGAELGPDFLEDFDIDLPEAWEFQQGSQEVVVAVIDNGIEVTHEDIYLNIFINQAEVPDWVITDFAGASSGDELPDVLTFYDLNLPSVRDALSAHDPRWVDTNGTGYIDGEDIVAWWSDGHDDDDPPNGCNDDLVGWDFEDRDNSPFGIGTSDHGTPVSGLIAAISDNGIGIAGVAPKVRILPVRSANHINEVVYILGFSEVSVINKSVSWPFSFDSFSDVDDILQTLEPEGVLFVASLGNLNRFMYGRDPSQRETVVSVSNFDSDGQRNTDDGSGYGPKTDVAAGGTDMVTIDIGNSYRNFAGTSSAAPIVSGVAALISSQNRFLSPEQIRQVIRRTAYDIIDTHPENREGWDLYSGWGLVNASQAINSLRAGTIPPEANILSLYKNYSNENRNEQFSIQNGTLNIRAYAGYPGGETVNWVIRHDNNWEFSSPEVLLRMDGDSYADGSSTFCTIETDLLAAGMNIIELDVEGGGVHARDRAVIDLPRAYIANYRNRERVIFSEPLRGFAYGPGFVRYQIFLAPGYEPAEADFMLIHTNDEEKAPALPIPPGLELEEEILMEDFNISEYPYGEATLRLVVEGSSTWTFEEEIFINNAGPAERRGFPLPSFYTAPSAPLAVDLDGDGSKELIYGGSNTGGHIQAVRPTGGDDELWHIRFPESEYLDHSIASGDVDNDGRPELVVKTTLHFDNLERIHIFNHDATEIEDGWPLTFENPLLTSSIEPQNSPVLADITLDGRLDILVAIPKSDPDMPAAAIRAYTISGTSAYEYIVDPAFARITQPAVGDVDHDNEVEIAAVAYRGVSPTLYVWERDGTLVWSEVIYESSPTENDPPLLMDIDHDGDVEIIVAPNSGYVQVFQGNGDLVSRSTRGYNRVKPICTQLRPAVSGAELAVVLGQSTWSGRMSDIFIGARSPFTGELLSSWSEEVFIGTGEVKHQPLVADLSGDPILEIAACNYPASEYYETPESWQLSVVDDRGNMVREGDAWPLYFPTYLSSNPLVCDLDGNDILELIVQTARTTSGTDPYIHVFNLTTMDGPGRIAWGEYAHDRRRTGNYHSDVRILYPNTAHQITVGHFDNIEDQRPIMIRTCFTRRAPNTSEGTDRFNWQVMIGDQIPEVQQVVRVQDEYWLLVAPISQPAPGSYDLRVQFRDGWIMTWDAYPDAVHYSEEIEEYTQIVIIDTSGSMDDFNKIDAAKVAARFFVESAYPDDEVGLISYATESIDLLDEGVVNAGVNRTRIADEITDITPASNGSTSIGHAIITGVYMLDNTANPENNWGMVLISDGLENDGPFWDHYQLLPWLPGFAEVPARPFVDDLMSRHPNFAIHTVALGPDADQELLEDIANVTGGIFHPVYLGSSLSLFNRLADVYHYCRERIDYTQRIYTFGGDISGYSEWGDSLQVIDGTNRLQFGLNCDKEYALFSTGSRTVKGIPFLLHIQRPDGSLVRASDADVDSTRNRTDIVITVKRPEPGQWKVVLSNYSRSTAEALLTVSAHIPVYLNVQLGPTYMKKGVPFSPIRAYMTDNIDLLKNVSINVKITGPDKHTDKIILKDNGIYNDGDANNGIYANVYKWELPGSYLITAEGTINTPQGPFSVTKTLGYYNRLLSDQDQDGIPDNWEKQFVPHCPNWLDPHGDPDGDKLDNITEWRMNTHPFKYNKPEQSFKKMKQSSYPIKK